MIMTAALGEEVHFAADRVFFGVDRRQIFLCQRYFALDFLGVAGQFFVGYPERNSKPVAIGALVYGKW